MLLYRLKIRVFYFENIQFYGINMKNKKDSRIVHEFLNIDAEQLTHTLSV